MKENLRLAREQAERDRDNYAFAKASMKKSVPRVRTDNLSKKYYLPVHKFQFSEPSPKSLLMQPMRNQSIYIEKSPRFADVEQVPDTVRYKINDSPNISRIR